MPTHNKRPDSEKPEINVPPHARRSYEEKVIKDFINYHDVIKIIESYRPYTHKMVVIEEHQIIGKVLNKIRTDLRKLKKGD